MDDLSIHELVGSFPIVSRFLDSAEKTFSPGGTSSAGQNATDIPIILVRFSAYGRGSVPHSQ